MSTPSPKNPFVWLRPKPARGTGGLPSWAIRRDRGALTVWEWAAIAGIIAVTLSVSLPAYRSAAGAAKGAACSANLQYQFRMVSMYIQDYDGAYPPLPAAPDLETATRPVQQTHDAWTERLAAYREAKKNEKNDPFACPASAESAMTYAYNAALGARVFPRYDPKGMATTEGEITAPAETYLLWDTANRAGANALAGSRYFSGARRDGAYRPGDLVLPSRAIKADWIRPRHNGAAAVLYCDGHIARLDGTAIRVEESRNRFDPRYAPASE